MGEHGRCLARGHLSEQETVQLGRAGMIVVSISVSHRTLPQKNRCLVIVAQFAVSVTNRSLRWGSTRGRDAKPSDYPLGSIWAPRSESSGTLFALSPDPEVFVPSAFPCGVWEFGSCPSQRLPSQERNWSTRLGPRTMGVRGEEERFGEAAPAGTAKPRTATRPMAAAKRRTIG
jgi:hypothetical protein